MQTEIDMYWNRAFVFPASCRDCCIDHGNDWNIKFRNDSEQQTQAGCRHVSWHRNEQLIAVFRCRFPHLFKLPADQIGSAQVLKSAIREWRGLQLGPKLILYPARFQACGCISLCARYQMIIFE